MRGRLLIVMTMCGLGCLGASPASPAPEPAGHRVIPGSALERLIRANQDYALLRPEELHDDLGLPPWLRVLWRKTHPDNRAGRADRADRSRGYPLVLHEVYEWMLRHQDFQPGSAETPPAAERAAGGSGERRISGAATVPRSESAIRIDPWHPARILAASNNTAAGRQAEYFSADGGASWGQALLPLVAQDVAHFDPTVDWTSDGTAWSVALGYRLSDLGTQVLALRAYRSADGGATWTFDATASGNQAVVDKEMLWVDHGASSPYKDRLYLIWSSQGFAFANHRDGGAGAAWGTPLLLSGGETKGAAVGADVTTNPAGNVFAFWPDTGDGSSGGQKLLFVKSSDGGSSFSRPAVVAPTFGSYHIAVPAFAERKALIYVSSAADRDGLVYAVWTDLSGTGACVTPGSEPGADVTSPCKTRVWFTRSTDGGDTWKPPVKINDPPALDDQFNPWLALDPTSGALGVMYYDTVSDPGRLSADVWYQSSVDHGVTWSAPVRVTSAPTDEVAAGHDDRQFGDYNGLSGHAGVFFPAWTDRRAGASGSREEIWTARIGDQPSCGKTLLCLGGGRFQAGAVWQTADGSSGPGQAVALTADTGYFWFFDPGNVEVVLKVLNGCAVSQSYWVFAAGLTDVHVITTVKDMQTGMTRTYRNPPGTPFLPLQDTGAFPACP
ncbi:MAG TPA: sialidase family protein [Thermoanaerobaculia bacterium]|nr:sialidase family protein [Thermoanaerobaculia bacterium]